jgi:hypothetical protein
MKRMKDTKEEATKLNCQRIKRDGEGENIKEKKGDFRQALMLGEGKDNMSRTSQGGGGLYKPRRRHAEIGEDEL